MLAPLLRTLRAVSSICSRLSTEQGPAITTNWLLPNSTSSPTRIMVGSFFSSVQTSLKGLRIGITDSTPGSDSSDLRRNFPLSSPIAPITVRWVP